MPEVAVAAEHEGHVPGEMRDTCRACRIGSDLDRIEALALGRKLHCEHRVVSPLALPQLRSRACHAPTTIGCTYCRRPICTEHQIAHRAEKHHESDLAAREAIGRVLWTEAHLSALRVAVIARTPLHDVLSWAEHASREVNGGRR